MNERYLTPFSMIVAGMMILCAVIYVYNNDGESSDISPDDIMASSVEIRVDRTTTEKNGTGFIIDHGDIFVVSSANIIFRDGVLCEDIRCSFYYDNETEYKLSVKACDISLGIAILVFNELPSDIKPLKYGNTDDIWFGEKVFAVGNPLGLGLTFSKGIISDPYTKIDSSEDRTFIKTDVGFSLGSDGGPLFDTDGNVIGMMYTKDRSDDSENRSIAIRSNEITQLIDSMISEDKGAVDNG